MLTPIAGFLGDSTVIPSTIVPTAPARKFFNARNLAPQLVALIQKGQGVNATIPGAAAVLPASVASKFTWKNVGIGGALAIAGYFVWTRLLAPPKGGSRPSTAPSTAASTISGLFGRRRRRRRR